MRIRLNKRNRERLFLSVGKKYRNWKELAAVQGVSVRTLADWRNGSVTIPTASFEYFTALAAVDKKSLSPKLLPDLWHIKKAASKGGHMRMMLYGNFGTPEGRKLGGLNSLIAHRKVQNSFFAPRKVYLPRSSAHLAEFIGILLGDGGITDFQVTITLHKVDDKPYIDYIMRLCRNLFHLEPSLTIRPAENVAVVIISRVKVVSFLKDMGLCVGSKVRNQIDVPPWIRTSKRYTRHCMRGLMDTDGSFYIDKHKYRSKTYHNCAMNFTNRSLPLLAFMKSGLEHIGLHPTQKTPFSLFLRREEEIRRYFEKIGSSNPKHYDKFEKYFRAKYGEIPTRS